MKLLVIADDDSFTKTPTSERADVLISCGDMADQVILQTAQAARCACIFAFKGNHDGAALFPASILDLHLRTQSFGGFTFGGFHGSWRYKPRGHFLYEQDEVADLVAAFPPVDVSSPTTRRGTFTTEMMKFISASRLLAVTFAALSRDCSFMAISTSAKRRGLGRRESSECMDGRHLIFRRWWPNESLQPPAPCRNTFSEFATTPCRGLSLSR